VVLDLYGFLLENNFYIDKNLCAFIETKLNTRRKAFLLKGPAGSGKTQLTYLISKFVNARYVFYQCTYGCGEDDLLYKYIPSEETRSGIKVTLGPLPLALVLSKSQKVVLVIDEFDKTRPSADALLLDLLQNFRISLYLNDSEQIIEGNPDNLVIFLTSNEMREFSEPLMRRLTCITLSHLPTSIVYQLLTKRFKQETALLLAQIYDDTVHANLRKPATIQELVELGEIIESGGNFDLNMLLKAMIIKYEDDWIKYLDYISSSSRQPYQFVKSSLSSSLGEDVAKYYEPHEAIKIENEAPESSGSNNGVTHVLNELQMKLKTTKPKDRPIEVNEVNDEREVCMIVEDHDKDEYSAIIKTLRPEPSEKPSEFGKFRMYFDNRVVIVSEKPLTFGELEKLKNNAKITGEFYAETTIPIVDFNQLCDILFRRYNKVEYYSKNLVRCSTVTNDNANVYVVEAEVCRRHDEKIVDVIFRMYIKGKLSDAPFIQPSEVSLLNTLTYSTYTGKYSIDYAKKLLDLLKFIKNSNVKVLMKFGGAYDYKCDVNYESATINISLSRKFAFNDLRLDEVFNVSENDIINDIDLIEKIIDYLVRTGGGEHV